MMKLEVLCVFCAILICSEATYYAGLSGKYGLGGLGYGAAGLGYGIPIFEKAPVAPVAYTLPAVGYNTYNTLPLGKNAYTAPMEIDPYGIVYDGAAAYAIVDPAYGAGLYPSSLKYTYGSPFGFLGKYPYPLKK